VIGMRGAYSYEMRSKFAVTVKYTAFSMKMNENHSFSFISRHSEEICGERKKYKQKQINTKEFRAFFVKITSFLLDLKKN
jgi:hypothetical protein